MIQIGITWDDIVKAWGTVSTNPFFLVPGGIVCIAVLLWLLSVIKENAIKLGIPRLLEHLKTGLHTVKRMRLTFWDGFRLYCSVQPRFQAVPTVGVSTLSSSDSEAIAVLRVENLSTSRLRDVIATVKAIRAVYDGDTPSDELERQLWPENYEQDWNLRWRGTAEPIINIDSSAILEVASIRTNQDVGDACVLPRQGHLPLPQFVTLLDYEIDIEIAPENGARLRKTYRLRLRKSNPPSAEFTAL